MPTALLRLRDLLLLVACSASSVLAAVLFLGRLKFATLFEAALAGRTLLWAAFAIAVAVGCAVGYVLGRPPCGGPGDGV
jgi:hypothetical protein